MLTFWVSLWALARLGVCRACHIYPIDKAFLCRACQADCVWLPEPFVVSHQDECHQNQRHQDSMSIQPATYYTPPMSYAIAAFKDNEDMTKLPYLLYALGCLAESLSALPADSVILPTPTTTNRLLSRGFSPVFMLARYLSAMTGFRLYTGVSRPTDGLHQRNLGKQDRQHNIKNAFVMDYPPLGQTIVIFDDVATTGATMLELLKVLHNHDSTYIVHGVCLAHGRADWDRIKH